MRKCFSISQLWLNLPFALVGEPGLLKFQGPLRIPISKRQWEESSSLHKPRKDGRGTGLSTDLPSGGLCFLIFLGQCLLNSDFTLTSPEASRSETDSRGYRSVTKKKTPTNLSSMWCWSTS